MSVTAIAVYRAPSSEPEPMGSFPQPATAVDGRHLSLVQPAAQLSFDDIDPLPQRHPGDRDPAAEAAPAVPSGMTRFARSYCLMAAEALTGFRPVEQLRKHTALGVMEWFRQYAIPIARHRPIAPAPMLRTVGVCVPVEGVAEVNAVIQRGPRARAMTARFVDLDGGWKCVHLQVI